MASSKSELMVITKAKDMCSYIMTVTVKSPKQYRFTFVSRLQNLALDVIENLYRANDCALTVSPKSKNNLRRIGFQQEALTGIKILAYFSMLAAEQGCILMKQYEQIALLAAECQKLTGAWIESDKRRIGKQ